MSDTDFTTQYAIRLPNGQLHARQQGSWYIISPGTIQYTPDEDHVPDPVVYDTIEDAEAQIKRFQNQAAAMGITEWMGHIESRVCSPFTNTEPGEGMVDDIKNFLEEQ